MDKILIVDDDIDLSAMLETFLQYKGFDTLAVHQAIDLPMDMTAFSAVLLDINLPGEDGYAICQRLPASAPGSQFADPVHQCSHE